MSTYLRASDKVLCSNSKLDLHLSCKVSTFLDFLILVNELLCNVLSWKVMWYLKHWVLDLITWLMDLKDILLEYF